MSARFTNIDHNPRIDRNISDSVILLRIDHALVARVLETKRVRWQNTPHVRIARQS